MNLSFFNSALSSLSTSQICIAGAVLFLASIIRGLTGFGFSAILVTGLTFILPPATTVVMALLLEITASAHLLRSVWRSIDWMLVASLGVGISFGTPIGMSLLALLDPQLMRLLISCLVLVFALLILRGFCYKGPQTFSVHAGLGFVSGVCNGTAALGGLPVVTFLLSTGMSVAVTRATLIAIFFGTDVYALIFAGGHGILDSTVIAYSILSLPLLLVGVTVGKKLFHVARPELFRKLSLILLLGLSSVGIIRSISIYFYS
ncbi:sulfite exporter TauE/SafE family protein [Desulfosediminicola flagellatus]|uniref:sulfite exporter TauE/SafE family protein n=1 Tax=Desulfosediminicola flagellatus TaxID=2569541 RepID=UPI0010ABDF61|nr:sulfite exporter TauE/SafE family protein [Desulfosediminicola flagellatus]